MRDQPAVLQMERDLAQADAVSRKESCPFSSSAFRHGTQLPRSVLVRLVLDPRSPEPA
jgi:hypothetical protein